MRIPPDHQFFQNMEPLPCGSTSDLAFGSLQFTETLKSGSSMSKTSCTYEIKPPLPIMITCAEFNLPATDGGACLATMTFEAKGKWHQVCGNRDPGGIFYEGVTITYSSNGETEVDISNLRTSVNLSAATKQRRDSNARSKQHRNQRILQKINPEYRPTPKKDAEFRKRKKLNRERKNLSKEMKKGDKHKKKLHRGKRAIDTLRQKILEEGGDKKPRHRRSNADNNSKKENWKNDKPGKNVDGGRDDRGNKNIEFGFSCIWRPLYLWDYFYNYDYYDYYEYYDYDDK
ncbi:uncharacterized protein LOC143037704 [Oratosquilla oratoria]|uniref:uncharacterized protein LOC143037704 n=1 Tax=Oratosquilla oratoria TaxID=337810 RepID=UPI003F76C2F5